MGDAATLTAQDGHRLSAYVAEPPGPPKGGLVIIQEIFGLNGHIRDICDRWAAKGWLTCAPALFDRVERGVDMGYDAGTTAKGRDLRAQLGWEEPLLDIAAARDAVQRAGKVGVMGFCWGGSVAWLAACRSGVSAASCWYGGQIRDFAGEAPGCPVEMHFGRNDPLIPQDTVEAVHRAQPDATIYLYDAGHGFNCDRRPDFDAESSALASQRADAFFTRHLTPTAG